jgi:hypothetical protein
MTRMVAEPLDEAERDRVLGLAVSGNALPMTFDHFGELLAGFEPLPFQAGTLLSWPAFVACRSERCV